MKHLRYLVLAFSVSAPQLHADVLSVHCPNGCPENPANNDLVFAHLYALSNNPETKFADWVAYEVNPTNFGATPGRVWINDPLLDSDSTLEKADYKGANKSLLQADRGHQAPLASFAGSRYWSELNYLSNITPQHKDLNQGPWKNLEEAVRKAATFNNEMPDLPDADESHQVPAGYFKMIYDLAGNSSSFVMSQNTQRKANFCDKRASIDQMQAQLKFSLPSLKDNDVIVKRLGCF